MIVNHDKSPDFTDFTLSTDMRHILNVPEHIPGTPYESWDSMMRWDSCHKWEKSKDNERECEYKIKIKK